MRATLLHITETLNTYMAKIRQYPKILVIQTAFIGDAILASSVLESIYAQFPEANLNLLVRSGNDALYKNHPFLKRCWVWNKQKNKILHLIKLIVSIRKERFNAIINLHRHLSSGLISGFSKADYVCGFKQNPCSFLFHYRVSHRLALGLHETQRYSELLAEFEDCRYKKPKLYPDYNSLKLKNLNLQFKYVVIAPGSVWFTKQAPLKLWIELCKKLVLNHTVFIIGAHSDSNICNAIAQSVPECVNVVGQLSLLDSAALMSGAVMNYVNDSAPLHLCSAVNAPVTVFFCSTVKDFGFGPLSDVQFLIETHQLSCRPCGLHGYNACPKKHFKCGEDLLPYIQSVSL